MYIRERGDAEIRTLADLVAKPNFWNDPVIPTAQHRQHDNLTLATGSALADPLRAADRRCSSASAEHDLDAVVYPTGNVPPGAPDRRRRSRPCNGRGSSIWTAINSRGFPAMTVPAGFTTVVYDRDADGTLLPPIPAALPVGIDFLGRPFGEHTLFAIALGVRGGDATPQAAARLRTDRQLRHTPHQALPGWPALDAQAPQAEQGRAAPDRRELSPPSRRRGAISSRSPAAAVRESTPFANVLITARTAR